MADIKIYGTLKNATESGKIANAAQVYDEAQGKFQSEINTEVKSAIPPKLRIASWNVGNFSLGTSGDPTITPETLDAMTSKWRNALNDLGADILCTCEYNTNFMDAQDGHDAVIARDQVFNDSIFKYAEIGPEVTGSKYMQTAIFTNIPMANKEIVYYPQYTVKRYYEVVDIYIAGRLVKLVATHLDPNYGSTPEEKAQSAANREAQMQKLIADFGAYPYVIMCADYNVNMNYITEYDVFTEAGFSMINHGYLGNIITGGWPGESPSAPLDNIIYKGFTTNKIDVVNDATLSDHMAIFADFTMIL